MRKDSDNDLSCIRLETLLLKTLNPKPSVSASEDHGRSEVLQLMVRREINLRSNVDGLYLGDVQRFRH